MEQAPSIPHLGKKIVAFYKSQRFAASRYPAPDKPCPVPATFKDKRNIIDKTYSRSSSPKFTVSFV